MGPKIRRGFLAAPAGSHRSAEARQVRGFVEVESQRVRLMDDELDAPRRRVVAELGERVLAEVQADSVRRAQVQGVGATRPIAVQPPRPVGSCGPPNRGAP
jgi:hypothetical protein